MNKIIQRIQRGLAILLLQQSSAAEKLPDLGISDEEIIHVLESLQRKGVITLSTGQW